MTIAPLTRFSVARYSGAYRQTVDNGAVMIGSTTRLLNSRKLAAKPDVAPVVLKLMMAINDMTLANYCSHEWDTSTDVKKQTRLLGTKLYFGRMIMAHLREAMLTIEEIQKSVDLMAAVDACGSETRTKFDKIAAYLKTDEFNKIVRLRNNTGFHYSGKLAMRALNEFATNPNDISLCIRGSSPIDWYYELGDKVTDMVVIREVFDIPFDPNMRAGIEEMLSRLFDVIAAFGDFAGDFIHHHAR
jgi:hypothetical protein